MKEGFSTLPCGAEVFFHTTYADIWSIHPAHPECWLSSKPTESDFPSHTVDDMTWGGSTFFTCCFRNCVSNCHLQINLIIENTRNVGNTSHGFCPLFLKAVSYRGPGIWVTSNIIENTGVYCGFKFRDIIYHILILLVVPDVKSD